MASAGLFFAFFFRFLRFLFFFLLFLLLLEPSPPGVPPVEAGVEDGRVEEEEEGTKAGALMLRCVDPVDSFWLF